MLLPHAHGEPDARPRGNRGRLHVVEPQDIAGDRSKLTSRHVEQFPPWPGFKRERKRLVQGIRLERQEIDGGTSNGVRREEAVYGRLERVRKVVPCGLRRRDMLLRISYQGQGDRCHAHDLQIVDHQGVGQVHLHVEPEAFKNLHLSNDHGILGIIKCLRVVVRCPVGEGRRLLGALCIWVGAQAWSWAGARAMVRALEKVVVHKKQIPKPHRRFRQLGRKHEGAHANIMYIKLLHGGHEPEPSEQDLGRGHRSLR